MLHLLSERAPEPVSFDEIERVVWAARVSRETIKQRVKMVRDSLEALGVPKRRNRIRAHVGYRLARTLDQYAMPTKGKLPTNVRRLWLPAAVLTICLCAVLGHLLLSNPQVSPKQLSLSVHHGAMRGSAAWDAARNTLVGELSRTSDLTVVAGNDGQPGTDLVVEMKRVPDGPYETLVLSFTEAEAGTLLWAETFGLDQDGYDKPISRFAGDVRRQIAALGLQPEPDTNPDAASRARRLYIDAASLAKTGKEADLLTAKVLLDGSLSLRPTFALARSLRARVDGQLVIAHGRDQRLVREAFNEARSLVDAHPDVAEFRRTLATAQIATGSLPEALKNLKTAERNMPFLRSEIASLKRRISLNRR